MKRGQVLLLLALTCLFVGCGKQDADKTKPAEQTEVKKEIDYEELSDEKLEVYSIDGDVKAQLTLATRYDYGTSRIGQSFEKAKVYYEMAAAAGDVDALRCLGYLYLNGCVGEADLDTASSYFMEAIEKGDVDSNVGMSKVFVAKLQEENAPEQAFSYADIAYQKGRPSGIYQMAYLIEEGIGTTQDFTKALELYQSVMILEDLSIYDAYLVDAATTRMGIFYAEGKGVEQDYGKALDYFKKSAKSGYDVAEYYMGQMYENGYGVDKDYEKAFDWYSKAAEAEYAPALNQLGYLYYKGNGVEADIEQTIYYHKLAAMQGYAAAQINLGYLYENGIGVEQNKATALKYYTMAAEQNNQGAKEAVARVQKQMNE